MKRFKFTNLMTTPSPSSSPSPIRLIIGVCYTNPNHLVNTIKSITDGILQPSDIVVADYGLQLPSSLRKKENVSIIRTPNYGSLSSLIAILEKYSKIKSKEVVSIILIDGQVTYMPHLIPEYIYSSPLIAQQLKSKITTTYNGCIYGLNGLKFIEDKQKILELELTALTTNTASPSPIQQNIKKIILSQDTATVDVLEFAGSIYMQYSYLEGFILNPEPYDMATGALIISNFMATKNIFRMQVCTLTNNRYIMEKIGCFSKQDKLDQNKYLA